MLCQFSFSNFKSYRDETTFDFQAAAELVDPFPGQGPLNALIAGFDAFPKAELLFLTATDMPFGDPKLVRALYTLLQREASVDSNTFDALIPLGSPEDIGAAPDSHHRPEPLFALYRRSCYTPAVRCMSDGKRSFKHLFGEIQPRFLSYDEIPGFDVRKITRNANTPEDYAAFQKETENH